MAEKLASLKMVGGGGSSPLASVSYYYGGGSSQTDIFFSVFGYECYGDRYGSNKTISTTDGNYVVTLQMGANYASNVIKFKSAYSGKMVDMNGNEISITANTDTVIQSGLNVSTRYYWLFYKS